MKTKSFKFLLLGTLVFASCADSSNEGETTDGDKVSPEYVGSAGFDWTTSRTVSFSVSSEKDAVVSLYLEKECTDESLLIEDLLVRDSFVTDLNIPNHCNVFYLQYHSNEGERVEEITLNVKARSEVVAITVPEDAVQPTSEDDCGFRFFHNTGVAMFEDNWPVESGKDNDLNDVVVEYDLKVTECQDEAKLPAEGYKEGLLLTLDIRAKGGRYPTKLGVVLDGLSGKAFNVATRIVLKKGQGIMDELAKGTDEIPAEVRQINGRDQYCKVTVDTKHGNPVIIMDGLSDLGDNDHFFQTTKEHIIIGEPMLRAEITITGKDRSKLSAEESEAQLKAFRDLITDTKKQNFFIVTNTGSGRETHLKGYRPTFLYTTYEADSQGLMMDGVPYCNKNGFVWGVKVPAGVRHAYEEVLFTEAYPKFEEWVESDGAKNSDWYLHPNEDKVVVKYW